MRIGILFFLLAFWVGCSSDNETKKWIQNGYPHETRHIYFYAPQTRHFDSAFASELNRQCGHFGAAMEQRRCRSIAIQRTFEADVFTKMQGILASRDSTLVLRNLFWHWATDGFSATINPNAGREILRAWPEADVANATNEMGFAPMSTYKPLDSCVLNVDTARHPCEDLGCVEAQNQLGLLGQNARIAVIDNGYSSPNFYGEKTRTISGIADIQNIGEQDFFSQFTIHRLRAAEGHPEFRHHGEVVSALIGSSDGGAAPSATVILLPTPPGGDPFYEDKVFRAFTNALAANVDGVNLSLGWTRPSEVGHIWWRRLLKTAALLDVAVIASSGNEGSMGVRYPANFSPSEFPNLISVGSATIEESQLRWLPFSSFNASHPLLVAPGCNVKVHLWSGRVFAFKGTSASAPIVSGLLAQLRGQFPNRTTLDLIEALKASGQHFPHRQNQIGFGAPHIMIAIKKLQSK